MEAGWKLDGSWMEAEVKIPSRWFSFGIGIDGDLASSSNVKANRGMCGKVAVQSPTCYSRV